MNRGASESPDSEQDYQATGAEWSGLLETERNRRGGVLRDAKTWEAMVAAFHATRHSEPRETDETQIPRPRPSERQVLDIYGSHFLFEVIEPPGSGYRLVNLVVDGLALTWELPGYGFAEAKKISTLLVDGYL